MAILTLPGKTMTRLLDPALLEGFKTVYVWQEPGAEDFPVNVAKALPGFTVKRMLPPEGVKDISEAHCRGLDVLGLMRQMQREAKEVTTEDHNGNASDREGSANSRARTQAFLLMFARIMPTKEGIERHASMLLNSLRD